MAVILSICQPFSIIYIISICMYFTNYLFFFFCFLFLYLFSSGKQHSAFKQQTSKVHSYHNFHISSGSGSFVRFFFTSNILKRKMFNFQLTFIQQWIYKFQHLTITSLACFQHMCQGTSLYYFPFRIGVCVCVCGFCFASSFFLSFSSAYHHINFGEGRRAVREIC